MRHAFLVGPVVLALALTGCSRPPAPEPTAAPPPAPPVKTEAVVPPDPIPGADGRCPYLDAGFVAEANGQKVSRVRLSADQPHPACFFYGLDGKVQLTARVYVGTPEVATALVDRAAPVDTANPADEPPGWRGGYQRSDSGAVYAIAKGGAAVVVTTNQAQSVKARTVAKQVVAAVGL